MSLPKWSEHKGVLWPLFVGLFAIWLLGAYLYRLPHNPLWPALLDMATAGVLWVSIFSGSPIFAVWAQRRDLYRRLHALAQPVLFDFLLGFTSRVGWWFFARALGGSLVRTQDLSAERFFWINLVAGLIAIAVEYARINRRLARAFLLNRRPPAAAR